MRPITPATLAAWVVIGILAFGPTLNLPAMPWLPSVIAPQKATAATYVFEKDTTSIPNEVQSALNTLNRKGITATVFEKDETDGNGQTPTQYVVPLKAATTAGLPALVATAGAKVLKVTKDPKTEADVIGGVP